MTFDEVKTDMLNLRVSPTFKATLKAVADAEHRSMVNMLEVLLANYCTSRPHTGKAGRRAAPKARLTR